MLEFFDKSHKGFNEVVLAANGIVQIPYSWLKDEDKRNLEEFRVVMKEGGVYDCITYLCFILANTKIV